MARAVIVNGAARSGKDTFCQLCQDASYFHDALTIQISSVDRIKAVAEKLGWTGEKDEKSRKFLSDLKDLATEYSDAPMKYLESVYNHYATEGNMIIFMHIREPEEIERARKKFDALTLLIKRPGVEPIQSNHADRDVDQYDYDYLVVNNGTLDDLGKQADDFVEKVISGYFEKRRDSGK